MSRDSRVRSTKLMKGKKDQKEWPTVIYFWILGLGFLGYVIGGEIVLGARPHPLHWLAGIVGAALGVPIGWLWYRWRGDVF